MTDMLTLNRKEERGDHAEETLANFMAAYSSAPCLQFQEV